MRNEFLRKNTHTSLNLFEIDATFLIIKQCILLRLWACIFKKSPAGIEHASTFVVGKLSFVRQDLRLAQEGIQREENSFFHL